MYVECILIQIVVFVNSKIIKNQPVAPSGADFVAGLFPAEKKNIIAFRVYGRCIAPCGVSERGLRTDGLLRHGVPARKTKSGSVPRAEPAV